MKEQLTLGELIDLLKRQDEERHVKFDFCYFHPTTLHSYRGYYEQLAINYDDEGDMPTVKDFLNILESSIGKTFEGWKGGEFRMDRGTNIWVDKPRNSSGTGVVGVRYDNLYVIIETDNVD